MMDNESGFCNAGLVSIVMPTYNASKYISEAVNSVRAQTYANWELLIVDDGSTDLTPSIINDIANEDSRIYIFKTEGRSGAANARNVAIREARGEFLAFLDSDDMWLPNKLDIQIDFMRERESNFSFAAYKKMDAEGKVGPSEIQVPSIVSYSDLLKSNHIGCLTAMYKRDFYPEEIFHNLGLLKDFGGWFSLFRGPVVHEDYSFWLRLLRPRKLSARSEARVAHGINVPLAIYRISNSSLSSNKFNAAVSQWVIYRNVEGLSLPVSLYYFLHYAIFGYLKYIKR